MIEKVLQEVHKMTINELASGQAAQIAHVDLLSPYAVRLLEMGFVAGTEIQVLARAPLGDAMLLQVRRHTLMLRKEEAQAVHVLPGKSV